MTKLIVYPFPLSDGTIIELHLPAEGLSGQDAERLKEYIATLVTDLPGGPE